MIGSRVLPPRRMRRHALRSGALPALAALALLAGCGGDPPAAPLSEGPPGASPADGVTRIAELSAQRAVVSSRVAAAKLGTGQAVTDPEREAAVVADARADATRAGVDPEWVARVVADQIAASSQVQNDLLRRWNDRPESRLAERPDLAQVRPELGRIGDELVAAMKVAAPARVHEDCPSTLAQAVVARAESLDDLHRAALGRALMSVCDRTPE
ncbi:gamma subclass chorismate mutase AroQ [Pseudonocardia parietis]|uniref:chorismate mutase n=1 Tax=Pseudonocardia parietis TaxID=570936 RepID=A0ABS4W377_9PSEU|nr:gamma subclass chorismate mutase AroQ [Pseudonocardia parietis]MBP2370615.1 chorismate mutase [Pseudonocardia parietis]